MKALVQRVNKAAVRLPGGESRQVGRGLAVLLGVGRNDTGADALKLAEKTAKLRIFSNDAGKFDLSLLDVKGEALVVSQFTLYGDCRKGCRPDFAQAAAGPQAKGLYLEYVAALKALGVPVKTGEFGADMTVEIENDGPVTVMIDTSS